MGAGASSPLSFSEIEMILEKGDMWTVFDTTDHFLITTNSFIRKDGALVMGRGIAREARDAIHSLQYAFGGVIKHMSTYGLVTISGLGMPLTPVIWAFQVKHHFMEQASLELIKRSTKMLKEYAERHTEERFDLNFPGIGNGRLTKEQVLPIIEILPDNVHVWEYGDNNG